MKNILLIAILLSLNLQAQNSNEFRVYLKDKGSSHELLNSPERFLSQEAINRRNLQGISIKANDLPIAPEYKKSLKDLGAQLMAHSKWLNYIYLSHDEPELIKALPFVERIEFPKNHHSQLSSVASGDTLDYGFARGQIEMLNGHHLHEAGYTGTGINIAVIDAGFQGFYAGHAFDSLVMSQRLIGTHNFITNDTNVFGSQGSHGTSVLSTMAAYIKDTIIGAAPHANYWLFTTENIGHEMPIEMDHWVMAAEFADSVGVHVINSSLTYRTFDNPQDDYSYNDMDGNTTVITKAADLAASKGILVVVGAGNEGDTPQPHIGAPADGDSVLAVGAVSWQRNYALFSSRGPSADGRVKPDVVAQGSPTALIDGSGNFNASFGTSFASPLIAGLAACLVEAYPSKHSEEIADYIRQSGHLYLNPNDSLGYGIPDFQMALGLATPEFLAQELEFDVYPNPVKDHIIINSRNQKNWKAQVKVYDFNGRCIKNQNVDSYDAFRLNLNLSPGSYVIQLTGDINGVFKFQSL